MLSAVILFCSVALLPPATLHAQKKPPDLKKAQHEVQQGEKAEAAGNWQEALAHYDAAAKEAPADRGIVGHASALRAKLVRMHVDTAEGAAINGDLRRATEELRTALKIDPGTVAARLNRLFDTIRPPGRGPLRNYEVLKALRARGIEMSAPYLSQLRAGRRSHPSLDMLRHLADFFGVSVAYFTDATSAYTRYLEAELCWLETANDPEVRMITTSLLTLPPDMREDLLNSTQSSDNAAE